jgi:predicted transcriptional regulator
MKQKPNKSLFLEQFGDTPQLRVMDFMIENHFFDFPLTEIARESNVSYNSLKSFINNFLESGFFIRTRRVGKSDYFKLNLENLFVQNLMKLDWNLTKHYTLKNEKSLIA